MLTLSYDETDGIIKTVATGTSNRSEVETYLFDLQHLIGRAREDWGRFWHLVDARAVEAQSEDALNCLSGSSIEQLEISDRTAVVMTSQRAIDQLSTMPSQFMTQVFPDMESAHAWIRAEA